MLFQVFKERHLFLAPFLRPLDTFPLRGVLLKTPRTSAVSFMAVCAKGCHDALAVFQGRLPHLILIASWKQCEAMALCALCSCGRFKGSGMRELACVKECLWGHITHSASALRQQPLLGAIVPHHSSNAKVHQLQGRIALARASLRTSQCRHIELAGSYSPLATHARQPSINRYGAPSSRLPAAEEQVLRLNVPVSHLGCNGTWPAQIDWKT